MKSFLITLLMFVSLCGQCQEASSELELPVLMFIPYTSEKHDIRTVLDDSTGTVRTVITSIASYFQKLGYRPKDFVEQLKQAKEAEIFTGDNQTELLSQLLQFAGPEIYVKTDIIPVKDGDNNEYNGIRLNLNAIETSSGTVLSSQTGSSGTFQTKDYQLLATKAVEKIAPEFLATMNSAFKEIKAKGAPYQLIFSFDQGSKYNMEYEIKDRAFKNVLADWIENNSFKNAFHIKYTTAVKMIVEDVRIPLIDPTTGKRNSASKFAEKIELYLKSLGIKSSQTPKNNIIYITIK